MSVSRHPRPTERAATRPPRAHAGPHATAQPVRLPAVRLDLLVLIATFTVGSALAGLFGAANLGTALALGTIAFAAVLVGLLLRRP